MRNYTVADVFTVADLLSGAIGSGSELGNLLKADGGESGESEKSAGERTFALVSYLLNECLLKSRERLIAWFASLHGVTVEEFEKLPPVALMDTVEELIARPDSKDFFVRASALYRQISGFGTVTKSK